MTKVVGVRFQIVGKVYYFSPGDLEMSRGTHVIVETSRGVEYATVIFGPKELPDEKIVQPLKEVIRVATEEDDAKEEENHFKEREAYKICKEKIAEHGLGMKLIKAEYTFDNNKLLFYFTADGRVDFRKLVKDLAGIFHTRIELRQVGVRDETKLLGGLGICGRPLCCSTFLTEFAPVSIRMAKEQNLSLNPSKISGVCGRLMCCLNNEAETYHHLNKNIPKNGSKVFTPEGMEGTVRNSNVLRQTVKVIIENGDEREIREYAVSDLMSSRQMEEKIKSGELDPQNRSKESMTSEKWLSSRNTHHTAKKADTDIQGKKESSPAKPAGTRTSSGSRPGGQKNFGESADRNPKQKENSPAAGKQQQERLNGGSGNEKGEGRQNPNRRENQKSGQSRKSRYGNSQKRRESGTYRESKGNDRNRSDSRNRKEGSGKKRQDSEKRRDPNGRSRGRQDSGNQSNRNSRSPQNIRNQSDRNSRSPQNTRNQNDRTSRSSQNSGNQGARNERSHQDSGKQNEKQQVNK